MVCIYFSHQYNLQTPIISLKGKIMIDNPITFISTILALTLTPGPCMSLALNSGLTVGIKRTQIVGLGDYTGLLIYAILSAIGVGALISTSPSTFSIIQYLGSAYLLYLGYKSFTNSTIDMDNNNFNKRISNATLFKQGFFSLISNPKAILFYGAFFPQFINVEKTFLPQLLIMITIIILSEFIGINIYAFGGKALRQSLKGNGGKYINRISGTIIACVGVWLALK